MAKPKDITGQRFGRLVALRLSDKKKYGTYLWECQCDCGNKCYAVGSSLVRGQTKSCGCLWKERNNRDLEELINKRFGKLTVKEFYPREKVNVNGVSKQLENRYLCICDCGNETIVNRSTLLSNKYTRSCGCINSAEKGTVLTALTKKLGKNNKTGVKGVCWDNTKKRYRASIFLKGNRYELGYFKNIEEATKARKKAEEKYFNPILKKNGREIISE